MSIQYQGNGGQIVYLIPTAGGGGAVENPLYLDSMHFATGTNPYGMKVISILFHGYYPVRGTNANDISIYSFKAVSDYTALSITLWLASTGGNINTTFQYSVASFNKTTLDWAVWNIHNAIVSPICAIVTPTVTPFTIIIGNVPNNNIIQIRLTQGNVDQLTVIDWDWSWT